MLALLTKLLFRLALPTPTASKRRRDGSLDLETGLEPKKSRNAPEPASNLTKSKSKSMMNIAGKPASAAVNSRFQQLFLKIAPWPILNSRSGARPGVSAPKSRVPPALNRVPPTTGSPKAQYPLSMKNMCVSIWKSHCTNARCNTGRASIAAVGRPFNDRTNRFQQQTFAWVMIKYLTEEFPEARALEAKGAWRHPTKLVGKDQHGMSKVWFKTSLFLLGFAGIPWAFSLVENEMV